MQQEDQNYLVLSSSITSFEHGDVHAELVGVVAAVDAAASSNGSSTPQQQMQ